MGGADEQLTSNPVGEFAQSCLGRERLFQYYSSSTIHLFLSTGLIMPMM
jgi:hypothetical protein